MVGILSRIEYTTVSFSSVVKINWYNEGIGLVRVGVEGDLASEILHSYQLVVFMEILSHTRWPRQGKTGNLDVSFSRQEEHGEFS